MSLETGWIMPPLTVLDRYFVPELAKKIHNTQVDTSERSFKAYINRRIEDIFQDRHPGLTAEFPSNSEHFLATLQHIVQPNVLHQILENLESFDKIAGLPCVEAFIVQRTFGDWLAVLSEKILQSSPPTTPSEAETKSKAKSAVETQKGQLGKRDEDKDSGKKKSIRKKISKHLKGIFTRSSETG
jgi:hypothetical protein